MSHWHLAPFRVVAVNTAADSENKIHDDRVAASYGFRGGLVPGVTVYGYMAAAVIEHFGFDWLERGAMDVRFLQPVYEGEDVEVTIEPGDSGRLNVAAGACASGVAWMHEEAAPDFEAQPMLERREASHESLSPGTMLGTLIERLDLAPSQMSAPLAAALGDDRLAHPAVLLALVNQILVRNFILGPWIHVATEVRNFSSARDGEQIEVRGKIEDRYERKGHEFVVLNALMLGNNAGETACATVRHTAIWRPRAPR